VIVEWNTATSSAEYVAMARTEAEGTGNSNRTLVRDLIAHVDREIAEPSGGELVLMDRRNWNVERPSLHIHVTINQLGNLVCRWQPLEDRPDDFVREVADHARNPQQAIGNQRPMNELLWVRNFGSLYARDLAHVPVVRAALVFAVRAKYEALMRDISAVMDIHPPRRYAFDWDTGDMVEVTT
jgi:hypothetical protein